MAEGQDNPQPELDRLTCAFFRAVSLIKNAAAVPENKRPGRVLEGSR